MGEAAKLPMRCRITLPKPKHQPRSSGHAARMQFLFLIQVRKVILAGGIIGERRRLAIATTL
jgi:hypothetical protein